MNVIRKVFLASTLSLSVLAGCDDQRTSTTRTDPDPATPEGAVTPAPDTYAVPRDTDPLPDRQATPDPAADPADANALQGDAGVLAMLNAIDKKEINASVEAMKKDLSQPVMEFSKMLHTEHSANLEKSMSIGREAGVEVGSPAKAEQLLRESREKLSELLKLDGQAFERAYIKEMIRGHMNALSTIDNQLLRSAQNDRVKQHLAQSREAVANHLKRAQQIQDEFDKAGADSKAPDAKADENKADENKLNDADRIDENK